MSTIHSGNIPNFIESRSPSGLRDLMLKNNTEFGTQFHYFDIQSYDKKGKIRWIAWYYQNEKDFLKSEVTNGDE